jgi:hypothetical protein
MKRKRGKVFKSTGLTPEYSIQKTPVSSLYIHDNAVLNIAMCDFCAEYQFPWQQRV